ncbi:MAG: hypothetical protein GXO65_03705 [Euryarchaeota archaeon]|nr:hypothetical protein [Euryarchaeota archaeon]
MEDTKKLAEKIDAIQKDLDFLKVSLSKHINTQPKKVVSLKGALKGLKVEEKDIEEARKSLFKTGV